MGSTLAGSRTWLDSRYRESGLPLPAFRWVQRKDARAGTAGPGDALLLQDADLRLYLLLLELDPALSPEAMAQQVHQDLQTAWALRSACLPGEGRGLPGAASAWRVALHWMVPPEGAALWRAALLFERQNGTLLEEIPVNATFLAPGEPPAQSLREHGFPSLLLATRAALRRDARASGIWCSADQRVREAVATLEQAFQAPRAREIARELQALAAEPVPGPQPGSQPRPLTTLSIQDVRGVRSLRLEPWPGNRPVQAWVLSGPNGSGKTSLSEAVSLKAFGTSPGLCAFLRDGDITKARTPDSYLSQYVTPLTGGTPRCGLDGHPSPFVLAPDLNAALESLAEAEGSIVPQGGPAGFLATPGEPLGARMAQGLSPLANRLGAHVEAGRQQAAESRAALARAHGIPAATRRLDSFQEKIIRAILAAALPPLPRALRGFLACRAGLPGEDGGAARRLTAAWNREERLDQAVSQALKALGAGRAELERHLASVLDGQEACMASLREYLRTFQARLAALPGPPLDLGPHAARWARWLAAKGPETTPAPSPAAGDLDRLLAERDAIAEQGLRDKPRQAHLETALRFIREHWRQPHHCPTCGSHLDTPVAATVTGLLATAERELAAHREAYSALTARIRQLENHPADPTAQGCPVPAGKRRQLETLTRHLLGPEAAIEPLLRDPGTLASLEELLHYAETPPAEPPPPTASAADCATAILAGCREAEQALAEPDAWELVAKELTQRLTRVVAEHLPATLEALWLELAASLSPAPWLLPAPAKFRTRTLRGTNRVEVMLAPPGAEPRLARHLLNDAQRDTLGLAWTFCQHLLQGRFRHAWLLLDDPAADMDQPAFRALCRFLASLLSLYEAQGRPFTLVLLLNQEDRAVDAARETGHGLILLGWTGRQEDATLHRVGIFGEGVRSPQPEDLFPATGS